MRRGLCVLPLFLLGFTGGLHAGEPGLDTDIAARLEMLSSQPVGRIGIDGGVLSTLVARFYALRGDAPAWQSPRRLQALAGALEGLSAEGLSGRDYGAALLAADAERMRQASLPAPQRARIDVRATAAYLLALRQVHAGVLDVDAVYPDWRDAGRTPVDDAWLLAAAHAVAAEGIGQALADAAPRHADCLGLRIALARLRSVEAEGGWPALPAGPTLKPGMAAPVIALLRRRLVLAGDLPQAEAVGDVFDTVLEQAVRTFQERHGLEPDGAVGPATRAALDVPVRARIRQLRLNLERARWYLHDAPARYVRIDIAGYRLDDFAGGVLRWSTRVQVGRSKRPTPVLRSHITYLTLNPQWVVPPTILREDILPRLRKDPGYLARNRIRVFDAAGHAVDAAAIDWSQPPPGLVLRQDAGSTDALGVVAFRFPNRHSIYLHDTPHQSNFQCVVRDFSSGCVRVEHALDLAVTLLGDPARWSMASLREAADGGATREVRVEPPVPLHIVYWTAHADAQGVVDWFPDIYDQDAHQLALLDAAETAQARAFAASP